MQREKSKSHRIRAVMLALLTTTVLAGCIPQQYYPISLSDGSTGSQTSQEYVNSLPYSLGQPEPAMKAFNAVGLQEGWSQTDLDAWSSFAQRIMATESGFCPNMLGGKRTFVYPDGMNCAMTRNGSRSDSGFGQILMSVHASWLCPNYGYCSKYDVIKTPYDSMKVFLLMISRAGKGPWCYRSSHHRRNGDCATAP